MMKTTLLYLFAVLSSITSLYNIYVSLSDFVNPHNLSFQLLSLTDHQILLFDAIVIIIHVSLLVLVYRFIRSRKLKLLSYLCISIWLIIAFQLWFENIFSTRFP